MSWLSSLWRDLLAVVIDRPPIGGTAWIYRSLHWLLVIGISVVLAINSRRWVPEVNPVYSWNQPLIQDYWCAWMFLACYAFIRSLIYAVGLFSLREEAEFPDIDEAWQRGLHAISRLGVELHRVPVFLVLGVPRSEEDSFFSSAGISWDLIAPTAAEYADAPLRFYLGNNAVYLGLSNVGAHALQLSMATTAPIGATSHTKSNVAYSPAGRTMSPGEFANLQANAPNPAVAVAPMRNRTLRPGEMTGIATAIAGPAAVASALPDQLTSRDTHLGSRRLRFLLRLLKRERSPFCAINGAILAVPWRWTSQYRSLELLTPLRDDVRELHQRLQLQFPLMLVQTGLDQLPGIQRFLERARFRQPGFEDSRAGSRFPPGAPLDRKHSEWIVDKSLDWFRGWIYELFCRVAESRDRRAESEQEFQHRADAVNDPTNRDLYQMLCTLEDRRGTLIPQLERVFASSSSAELPRLYGIYFCSKEPTRAFLKGIFSRIQESQNDVAYTLVSQRRDQQLTLMAILTVVIGLLLSAAAGWLGWKLWGPG